MRLLPNLLWRLRGNRQGSDPGQNFIELITDGTVNLVIPGAAVQEAVLLPSPSRYPCDLLKLDLGYPDEVVERFETVGDIVDHMSRWSHEAANNWQHRKHWQRWRHRLYRGNREHRRYWRCRRHW